MHPWLKALRHDLLKRAVWPARDLRDMGGRDVASLRRGLYELTDPEGASVSAEALWARMRSDAPKGCARACDAFEKALRHAVGALEAPWPAPLDAILALETAFADLARAVDATEGR
jgi:hypothetical protein